jgi:hypothetical protein
MKFTLIIAFVLASTGTSFAAGEPDGGGKLRLAEGASATCVSNCSTQAASCKRTCPATFSTPCLNACDSQAQTCARSCQAR